MSNEQDAKWMFEGVEIPFRSNRNNTCLTFTPDGITWPEIGADPGNLVGFHVDFVTEQVSKTTLGFPFSTSLSCYVSGLSSFAETLQAIRSGEAASATLQDCDDGTAFYMGIRTIPSPDQAVVVTVRFCYPHGYWDWDEARVFDQPRCVEDRELTFVTARAYFLTDQSYLVQPIESIQEYLRRLSDECP